MIIFWKMIFWGALFLLTGHYIGYPLFFWLIAKVKLKNKYDQKNGDFEPPEVTLIISAYNEAQVIGEKIKNSLELDYPKDKLKIVVVSDGSTDATNEIVKSFASSGVELFVVTGRLGKTNALNEIIPKITTEIIIFSDANSMYDKSAIKLLVQHFNDPKVGAVCGELRFTKDSLETEGFYWKYEQFIKRLESLVSTVTVFNGAIYAMRRKLHQKMCVQSSNDLQHAIQVRLQNYYSVYEPRAIAYEQSGPTENVEFKRHVRISSRSWKGFVANLYVLNPFVMGSYSLQFFFRKLCRWLGPGLLLAVFISSFVLRNNSILYYYFFVIQCLAYFTAMLGGLLQKTKLSFKLGYFLYYFFLINWASVLGFLRFLINSDTATWSPTSHCSKKS